MSLVKTVISVRQKVVPSIVKELDDYIRKLTSEEKRELAEALKKKLLLAEAERLSSFSPRKKIFMADVVKEVRIVRKSRHASKGRH